MGCVDAITESFDVSVTAATIRLKSASGNYGVWCTAIEFDPNSMSDCLSKTISRIVDPFKVWNSFCWKPLNRESRRVCVMKNTNRESSKHPGQRSRQKLIDAEWRNRGVNRSAIYDHSETEAPAAISKTSPEPTKWIPPWLKWFACELPRAKFANVHSISEVEAAQMLVDADAGQPESSLLTEV